MRETAEFRISEDNARSNLDVSVGTMLGNSVRRVVISTDDPLYQQIGDLERQFRARGDCFHLGWDLRRRYTNQEFATAAAFHIRFAHTFEPCGEMCGSEYDESAACPVCGGGAPLIGDLRLDLRKAPKTKDLARTIAGENIVSQRLAERLVEACLTGFELRRVRHKARYEDDPQDLRELPSGRLLLEKAERAGVWFPDWEFWVWLNREENNALCEQARAEYVTMRRARAQRTGKPAPVWYQLVPVARVGIVPPTRTGEGPFDDDVDGRFRCPRGDTLGLNLLSELSISGADFRAANCDLMETRQRIGTRRGVLRPESEVIISPRFWRVLEDSNAKGFAVEVAHLK